MNCFDAITLQRIRRLVAQKHLEIVTNPLKRDGRHHMCSMYLGPRQHLRPGRRWGLQHDDPQDDDDEVLAGSTVHEIVKPERLYKVDLGAYRYSAEQQITELDFKNN